MPRSAMGKLAQADDLDKSATKLKQTDPESSRELKELARKTRKTAIRQMKRRPRRPKRSRLVL